MRVPDDDAHPVIPGAQAWSSPGGGPRGALVLHGFTGNPSSVRGLAEAFAAGGLAVEMPRLSGHGTHLEDMLPTRWEDWLGEAERALAALAERCPSGGLVAAGLSMGGMLALALAQRHPGSLAGIVCINTPAEAPPELVAAVEEGLAGGLELTDAVGGDIADPSSPGEQAYDATPLRPLLSLLEAGREVRSRLGEITCPALLITSRQDHVVDPADSEVLAGALGGRVERLMLERSYHVATVDYERDLLAERAVEFALRVSAGG